MHRFHVPPAECQGETVRLSDFGLSCEEIGKHCPAAANKLIREGNTPANRARLAELIDHH